MTSTLTQIYTIQTSGYEGIKSLHILEGPPGIDINALCDSLLDEASKREVGLKGDIGLISDDDVIDHLADILIERYGFDPVSPLGYSLTFKELNMKSKVAKEANEKWWESMEGP